MSFRVRSDYLTTSPIMRSFAKKPTFTIHIKCIGHEKLQNSEPCYTNCTI